MTDILLQKVNEFIKHFNFTVDDIENEVDFAYEACCESNNDDSSYHCYYTLFDEVQHTYNVNNVDAQINELVVEFLTNK